MNTLSMYIADGLISTGIEGGYDAISCSTAGDYPSLGVSQWEGERANELLSAIGADRYINRSYSSLSIEEMEYIANLLDSPEGQQAQRAKLASDCEWYIDEIKNAGVTDAKSIIYCGMWCPTSVHVVVACIEYAINDGIDVDNVEELADYFFDNYAYYAACEEYEEGYQNRSDITLEYCLSLDI